jgi:dUTP pyrophosphatase
MGLTQSKTHNLGIRLIDTNAQLPTRTTPGAAGYDMFSAVEILIPAHSRANVSIGISINIPVGCYGRIAPRSGLALNHSIDVAAGVIDQDYNGSVSVVLVNNGNNDYTVHIRDRIAQLILERIYILNIVEIEVYFYIIFI